MNVAQRAAHQLLGCTDETEFKTKLRAEMVLALEGAARAIRNEVADAADGSGPKS